jgi:putative Mn2+ efflux pump MntP
MVRGCPKAPPFRIDILNFASTALLALAMSTDAFAAAIGKGLALHRPGWPEALRTGAIFGVIEALTPIVGWLLGVAAGRFVSEWDHWIAFALLGGLGVRMIRNGLAPADEEAVAEKPTSQSCWLLAATGFATSIDAMAVGVSLAFLDVDILPVAAAIGCTTLVLVTTGVLLGRVLGVIAGRRAEMVGGIVLIGIGIAILHEHLAAAAL